MPPAKRTDVPKLLSFAELAAISPLFPWAKSVPRAHATALQCASAAQKLWAGILPSYRQLLPALFKLKTQILGF
jgi:hypothetical protein